MPPAGSVTLMIEDCLRRIDDGDEDAVNDLIDGAYERLVEVTHRIVGSMVSGDRGVRASDVFQEAYLRLSSALLKDNVSPKSVGEFMGLAARHIRFQVLDMLRATQRKATEPLSDQPKSADGDHDPEMWIRFFEAFEELPEQERAVADLLWIWVEGKGSEAVPNLTQQEAAEVLGVSRDKVKDIWRNAKIKIAKKCIDFNPMAE